VSRYAPLCITPLLNRPPHPGWQAAGPSFRTASTSARRFDVFGKTYALDLAPRDSGSNGAIRESASVGLGIRECGDFRTHEDVASVPAADADPAAPARTHIQGPCAIDDPLTSLKEKGAALLPPESPALIAHVSSFVHVTLPTASPSMKSRML
jgi:hypothetical protein